MEKLSPRCKMICLGAVISLVAGIAASPAAPRISFISDDGGRGRPAAAGGMRGGSDGGGYVELPNCAGGDSVNCHRQGNQAGL